VLGIERLPRNTRGKLKRKEHNYKSLNNKLLSKTSYIKKLYFSKDNAKHKIQCYNINIIKRNKQCNNAMHDIVIAEGSSIESKSTFSFRSYSNR